MASDFRNRFGEWALLVGAAEGIGEAFSIQLAEMRFNIIMVDKQEESMQALAKKLEADHGIEIKTLHVDLKDSDAAGIIMKRVAGLSCRLMIYNAAFSLIKKFTEHSQEDIDTYLNVNVSAPLKLTHAFATQLKEKKQSGGILLMSSLAGLLGLQLIAPYAASKAFTWNLAEALHHELKPEGIAVTACIAGATLSQTYIDTKPKYGLMKPQLQTTEQVAKLALKNLGKKGFFIAGFANRLNYFILTRILPRKMAGRIANNVIKEMYLLED